MAPTPALENDGTGFSGTWFSDFARLTMEQEGAEVTGTYEHKGGRMQGTLSGGVLRGTWTEPEHGKQGSFEFTLADGHNNFHGVWRYQGEAHWRPEPWSGVRLALPAAFRGGMPGGWNSYPDGPLLAGPMVGEVGETHARVWVQAREASPLTLTVTPKGGGAAIHVVAQPAWEDWLCAVFDIQGLSPGATYSYSIAGACGATESHGFRAAPPSSARRLRIALGSCFQDYGSDLPIFDAIGREHPDLFLMVGDNCYYYEPDWQTEHTMMLAQLRHRNNPSIRKLLPGVPTLGIWDDHDFGPNDSDGTFSGKELAFAVFKRVWAQRTYGTPDIPGIFSVVRFGPVELFLLDGRSYRIEEHRILGGPQLAWLKERLHESDAPLKLVVTGSQVLPQATVPKGWECFRLDAPGELDDLLGFIEQRDIRGVFFVSGDVHLGYLAHAAGRKLGGGDKGPELWELTASPLANQPWHEHLVGAGIYDPYLLSEAAVTNYGVVDIDLDRAGRELILTLKNSAGAPLFTQPVALESLRVRPLAAKSAAAGWSERKVQFFKGEQLVRHSIEAPWSGTDRARLISSTFPGLWPSGIDAAIVWPNGKAYFFKGNGYVRYDLAAGRVDPGYPRYIAETWKGLFAFGIDAAVVWPNGKAYFFRGGEYVRYDIAADRADPGYPKPIAGQWPGLWASGIDGAVVGDGGKAYFFKGDQYIRYDIATDRADPGYPQPMVGAFWGGGIA
jgi:alkaline phosphatase D